jgi:hypothetical protein
LPATSFGPASTAHPVATSLLDALRGSTAPTTFSPSAMWYGASSAAIDAPGLQGRASAAAPSAPAPVQSSGSAGPAGSGVAFSLFALLVSLAAFALGKYTLLTLSRARWRPLAFVAVIERPG